MKNIIIKIVILSTLLISTTFTYANGKETYSLTIKVDELRNSKGVIQFTLYNKDDSIPDERYEKYFRKQIGSINKKSSSVIFNDLPKGRYAINILHDENKNEKIDKGFILPIEGIGFSNYHSIGLANRPSFFKASFEVKSNLTKYIKIIYM